MDFKPVLTYTGDLPLFRSLQNQIVTSIPNNTSEWKRSYGRLVKNIRLEASFQQFNTALLDKYKAGEWNILEQPVLHIYVTECSDVEMYKSTLKDEIDSWLKVLQSYDITDWMVLVVETLDMKKTKNILPRTTVLDKIRSDFASKNEDRCISVLNPLKFEMKATESFRCLLQRIRYLMLSGYNRNIVKFEDLIRTNREKRNRENWSFVNYFLLQEQLAFVFEMLGLHSEALIQYDELDAMFSQFVLNSVYGEKPKWLEIFEKPLQSFHGISLNKSQMVEIRKKIEAKTVNLLEFRSYLFDRQCLLLQASEKPWEIAERLLNFLFATLKEIEALKLETPEGALACYEFVCALEVLNICDQAVEADDSTKCFQYSAPIWNLAKDKLYELGKLCGLLPGCTPTSEQLHIVVQLSAGIGDTITDEDLEQLEANQYALKAPSGTGSRSHSPARVKKPPTERLKEALGSNQAFQKLYLELSELAISTYKHVSRLRSARLVGLDLGNFYCTLNEPNKAVVFFTDLLRELKSENWNYLVSQTLLELASCYRKMDDMVSYTKTCSAISCCIELEILVRTFYFDEFLKSTKELKKKDEETHLATSEDHFKIKSLKLLTETPIIQDRTLEVELKIESNFPREIIANKIALCFENFAKTGKETESSIQMTNSLGPIMNTTLKLTYKEDGTLESAHVAIEPKSKPVRRSSSTRRKTSPTTRSDFTNSIVVENCSIKPGVNVIELKSKALRVGVWVFKQLSIEVENIEFLTESLPIKQSPFEITTKPASAVLNFQNLIAGIEQPIQIMVSAGSFVFPSESTINLKCSKSLQLKIDGPDNQFQKELSVTLSNMKPFEDRTVELRAICDLPGRREDKPIEHTVDLHVPWSRATIPIQLKFSPALIATCRLHSSGIQQFLQVIIKGVLDSQLVLSEATMKCDAEGVELQNLNPKSQNEIKIYKNLTVSYLWKIQVEPLKTEKELPIIKVNYQVKYATVENPEIKRSYSCAFDVTDYKTLFKIQAKVEPSELCRVSSVCTLNLKIIKVQDNPFTDLMYEVLADQNTWAVCGRSSGVVSMQDVQMQSINLEVLPLTAGFLALPTIRISKYVQANKGKQDSSHPKLQQFPPGQIYNSTKSMQIHVLASNNAE